METQHVLIVVIKLILLLMTWIPNKYNWWFKSLKTLQCPDEIMCMPRGGPSIKAI